jgi:hypothetical protein
MTPCILVKVSVQPFGGTYCFQLQDGKCIFWEEEESEIGAEKDR